MDFNKEIMNHEYIWGFMYGKPTVAVSSTKERPDELIRIKTDRLSIYNDSVIYIWGGPGPDFNIYKFKDFKTTWCFDPINEMPNTLIRPNYRKFLNQT